MFATLLAHCSREKSGYEKQSPRWVVGMLMSVYEGEFINKKPCVAIILCHYEKVLEGLSSGL